MGMWTSALWAIAVGWAYLQPETHAALSERVREATGADIRLFEILDPSAIGFGGRFQQIIVFIIVAMILALAVRRSNALLISHAGIERERTNLARYFSPNVVDELPRTTSRSSRFAPRTSRCCSPISSDLPPIPTDETRSEVIDTLRRFHERMEREVFRHGGTLDKYLGDGLMATFGTPFAGDCDAGTRCVARGHDHFDRRIEHEAERSQRAADPAQPRLALRPGRAGRHRPQPARIRRHRHHRECGEPARSR